MLSLILALLSPAFARCEPTTSAQLANIAKIALDAYADNHSSAFLRARAEGEARIPCLEDLVTPEAVARWYQVEGIQAFLDRRTNDIEAYFKLAQQLDPDIIFEERLAPDGHPLRMLWDRSLLGPAFGEQKLSECVRGEVFVDGFSVSTLPADRPFIVQLITEDGEIRRSLFVQGEIPEILTCDVKLTRSRQLGLTALGGVAIAGGLWAASAKAIGDFYDVTDEVWDATDDRGNEQDKARYDAAVRRANVLGISAEVVTGLTVSAGTVALVVRF